MIDKSISYGVLIGGVLLLVGGVIVNDMPLTAIGVVMSLIMCLYLVATE